MNLIRTSQLLLLPLTVASALLLASCDDDDGISTGPTGTVTVLFQEMVQGADLIHWNNDVANIIYTNAAGNVYGVDVFEYLVSNFSVTGTNKHAEHFEGAHYRNAFDPATNQLTLTGVPVGSYHTLGFWWGLPDVQNMGSSSDASVPRGLTADFDFLLWPMGTAGGYHCYRFEGPYDKAAVGDGNFTLHMGRLHTMDGRQTNGHQPIAVPVNFEVLRGEETVVVLNVDVNALMSSPEIDFTASTADGPLDLPTMMNHGAQALMRDNMVTGVFSAEVD